MIMNNSELQELLSQNLRDADEKTRAERKAYYIGAGKLLNSVKIDIEAANIMGKKLFGRTMKFLEEEEEEIEAGYPTVG
jgi:hypothetical protein